MSFRAAPPSSAAASIPEPVPSAASSLRGLFQFVSSVGVLSLNGAHCPYRLTVLPSRCEVAVQLKTIALHGLSYADFQLATHIDGLEIALKRQRSSRRPAARQEAAAAAATHH